MQPAARTDALGDFWLVVLFLNHICLLLTRFFLSKFYFYSRFLENFFYCIASVVLRYCMMFKYYRQVFVSVRLASSFLYSAMFKVSCTKSDIVFPFWIKKYIRSVFMDIEIILSWDKIRGLENSSYLLPRILSL